MEKQFGDGAPDLAFEMEHAMQDVVTEGNEAAMNVCRLAARRTVRTGQRGAAVAAIAVCCIALPALARRRAFDRVRDDAAGNDIARCFAFDTHARENIRPRRRRGTGSGDERKGLGNGEWGPETGD